VVAGRTFAELLTTDREAFQREALARLKERCGEYSGRGLGVQLEGLALLDLHPPQEVVQAYHEVTKAMESRDQQVNQAQAAATSRERAQEASSLQVVREAEAARKEKVSMARARLEAFLARYRARQQLSFETEAELFGSLLRAAANGQAPADAVRDYRKRHDEALSRQAALTDFRLYWDLLAAALTGREKVIVDADKVPGRRHLWLLPFDAFRVPVPIMAGPPERGPMAPPRGP
jgi:regulator of protease activity HflC (stomatin/prohibitin superfamily)